WYGSSYGGFFLNPKLLKPSSIVYSFGIGEDISFDLKVIKTHHCQVLAFDPTPRTIRWVNNQKLPSEFIFQNIGLSETAGMVSFNIPANPKRISGSLLKLGAEEHYKSIQVMMKSFEQLAKENGHNHVDLLKMDIEGAEYEVIESILVSGIKIDQLLVEFHDRCFDMKSPRSVKTVETLKKHGYEIFAASKSFEEISFIRKECL
ncbi:MAG: FkbM family methyltransferase, partial [Bacteroidales bacterium]|nr:FkbM family methyltransferase [Bacteroidales bacterium]